MALTIVFRVWKFSTPSKKVEPVGERTTIESRVTLNKEIIFESTPGSLGGTYYFCKNGEPFKVPKSLREDPWSLFQVVSIICHGTKN